MGRVFDHAIAFVVEARGHVREHDDSDIFLGSGLATGRSEHHCCKTGGSQQKNKFQLHTVLPEMVQHRRLPYALKDRPVILLLKSTLLCNPARTGSRRLFHGVGVDSAGARLVINGARATCLSLRFLGPVL